MKPTVDVVVKGLLTQGYKECGGSDVFRILVNPKDNQAIKVFYDNYDNPNYIIIRESIEAHPDHSDGSNPTRRKRGRE